MDAKTSAIVAAEILDTAAQEIEEQLCRAEGRLLGASDLAAIRLAQAAFRAGAETLRSVEKITAERDRAMDTIATRDMEIKALRAERQEERAAEGRQAIKDYDITEAMMTLGGSFVAGLGSLYRRADPINQAKLRATFARYFLEYADLARLTLEQPARREP